jgi:small subunit ribosomal protein S3Ae
MAAVKKIIHVRHVGIEKAKIIRTAEAEIALLQA